ncbi:hypothetical protein HZ99_14650 [Pseudomonas fluorescens]|nr:hypothetical protein HZ99_14650 [Pseudomonas fluorescens]
MTAFQESDPLPDALSGCQGQPARGVEQRVKKANRYRSGLAGRENSGAPTPTGVCLDYSHQEFADDQHGEGLIHTFPHSNVASPAVQYGAANTGAMTKGL